MTHSTSPLTPEQKKERVEAKIAARQARTTSRGERQSFNGTTGKLKVGHLIDGYHLHILNDVPGRIEQALGAGYEFVSPDEVGGTAVNVVSRNTDIGDKVRFLVGTDGNNQPMYAYLMKIRNEFYEEDQNAIQERVDRTDAAIRQGQLTKEGHSTEGFYVPKGGIKMSN